MRSRDLINTGKLNKRVEETGIINVSKSKGTRTRSAAYPWQPNIPKPKKKHRSIRSQQSMQRVTTQQC